MKKTGGRKSRWTVPFKQTVTFYVFKSKLIKFRFDSNRECVLQESTQHYDVVHGQQRAGFDSCQVQKFNNQISICNNIFLKVTIVMVGLKKKSYQNQRARKLNYTFPLGQVVYNAFTMLLQCQYCKSVKKCAVINTVCLGITSQRLLYCTV